MVHKDDEIILAVPRSRLCLPDGQLPQGFFETPPLDYAHLIAEHVRPVRRGAVETDPDYKQIIPYVVITRAAEVWVMRRLGTQDEARLRNQLSLGVGGHARPEAGAWETVLAANLRRELHEELDLDRELPCRLAGYVNDDSNPVGQVHLGLVYRAAADGVEVRVRERELMEGWFASREQLLAEADAMETWSALIWRQLLRK